ncbi:MAG: hypothetical protein V1844_13315 [Pseudomonadota bacterium]
MLAENNEEIIQNSNEPEIYAQGQVKQALNQSCRSGPKFWMGRSFRKLKRLLQLSEQVFLQEFEPFFSTVKDRLDVDQEIFMHQKTMKQRDMGKL